MSIEVKDKDSVKASEEIIRLIKKYKRHKFTVIGGEENYVTERLLKMDGDISTWCSKQDLIKIILTYFVGMLPYLKIEREVAMLPYMTQEFIAMKYKERSQANSFTGKAFLTFYIYVG